MVKKSFFVFHNINDSFHQNFIFLSIVFPLCFLIIYIESEVLQFQLRFDIFQIGIYEDI